MSTLLSFFCMNVDQESRTDTASNLFRFVFISCFLSHALEEAVPVISSDRALAAAIDIVEVCCQQTADIAGCRDVQLVCSIHSCTTLITLIDDFN